MLHKTSYQDKIKQKCQSLNDIIEEQALDAIDKLKSLVSEQQSKLEKRVTFLKDKALENYRTEVPKSTLDSIKEVVQNLVEEHATEQENLFNEFRTSLSMKMKQTIKTVAKKPAKRLVLPPHLDSFAHPDLPKPLKQMKLTSETFLKMPKSN